VAISCPESVLNELCEASFRPRKKGLVLKDSEFQDGEGNVLGWIVGRVVFV
jgi:hypothetical protein